MNHQTPKLTIDRATFSEAYDTRPIGFEHNLHQLDILQFDALRSLAKSYDGHRRDFFIAASASAPGQTFRDVKEMPDSPEEALGNLDGPRYRVLLKRPERYSPAFEALINGLFDQVASLRGGALDRGDVVRLESAILISSSQTTTPFHFDPEIGFFCQVEGDKEYHAFEPSVLDEHELETFYRSNVVDIGQVDLASRDKRREHVFDLRAGLGFHQPQNAPHWVHTGPSRSISYTMVFETVQSRAKGRARAFNYYQRKLGLAPMPPGQRPSFDSAKAQTMQMALPLRSFVGRTVRGARRSAP